LVAEHPFLDVQIFPEVFFVLISYDNKGTGKVMKSIPFNSQTFYLGDGNLFSHGGKSKGKGNVIKSIPLTFILIPQLWSSLRQPWTSISQIFNHISTLKSTSHWSQITHPQIKGTSRRSYLWSASTWQTTNLGASRLAKDPRMQEKSFATLIKERVCSTSFFVCRKFFTCKMQEGDNLLDHACQQGQNTYRSTCVFGGTRVRGWHRHDFAQEFIGNHYWP